MMGERTVRQGSLFYGFSLEDHVPQDHFMRSIGRPSIDPEPMIRMLLIGYVCGIRSERRLCQEVSLNLAHRWFCRLDLTDPIAQRSPRRERRQSRCKAGPFEPLQEPARPVSRQRPAAHAVRGQRLMLMAEGIVGDEGFAVDASMIRADAHRQHGVATSADLDPERATRAVAEYLAVLDDAAFAAEAYVAPKFVSLVDPAARWMAAAGGPARPTPTWSPDASAKRSRSCSRISSASSGWTGGDYADPTVPATSSTSPPPLKTCESCQC